MTDHPLTEEAVAEMWDEHHTPASPILRWSLARESERKATQALLRAAFDAGREHERANPADARPWEPLNGPVRVGDEVRQVHAGITATAVVGRVDRVGSTRALYTAEGQLIGVLDVGTWYHRRTAPELPTKDGAGIIPADGREFIEQVGDCAHYRRLTYDAASGRWIGWDTLNHEADALFPRHITPGTWQVADQ